jgi:anthranilate synthase
MKYITKGNIKIERASRNINFLEKKEDIIEALNNNRGAYFCSSFEYPNRYTRWDMGFINPPVEIRSKGKKFNIKALNQKGEIILKIIYEELLGKYNYKSLEIKENIIKGKVKEPEEYLTEENRSRKLSIFTLIRDIKEIFFSEEDEFFGLYGSFGYDLIYQFENMELSKERDKENEDMVLFIPDEIFIMDHQRVEARILTYEIEYKDMTTLGLSKISLEKEIEHLPKELINPIKGKYADLVRKAKISFEKGDLFEVVPSHIMEYETEAKSSELFKRLIEINPSPYGFFINIGTEKLVGASPEMYVRVIKDRIETCPISGTVKRGKDAMEDYENIMQLLNSEKEESELTMCTDVDRNDKSRICKPNSVKVIGRRQIEKYSHLIHTVDHVTGVLREEYDSIDAFITHMWAVTVTGAPKRKAIKWIEENEKHPREWYAGAIGFIGFNGDINTGLTLRTIYIKGKKARVRVGATLLYDSVPELEEEETYIKAQAMVKVLTEKGKQKEASALPIQDEDIKVLIIDNEDSFVHTLGDYFRGFGVKTDTVRHEHSLEFLKKNQYDMVVLSPGPGRPEDFELNEKIKATLEKDIPIFGVCLGLQAIVEYFGGELGQLNIPYHGKKAYINLNQESKLFNNIDKRIVVGRYHSLYGKKIPDSLIATSSTDDGIVMSLEHEALPVYAVQFHPESIMTTAQDSGFKIIKNMIEIAKEYKNGKDIRRIS